MLFESLDFEMSNLPFKKASDAELKDKAINGP